METTPIPSPCRCGVADWHALRVAAGCSVRQWQALTFLSRGVIYRLERGETHRCPPLAVVMLIRARMYQEPLRSRLAAAGVAPPPPPRPPT